LAEGSDTNIVVKDKDGKATTEKIEDFLSKTFKKEKPWLYAGSGARGSGLAARTDRAQSTTCRRTKSNESQQRRGAGAEAQFKLTTFSQRG
jgi:hypothetical protein